MGLPSLSFSPVTLLFPRVAFAGLSHSIVHHSEYSKEEAFFKSRAGYPESREEMMFL